jgi:c-di-GMP-binding flagellar brake protein YcgR
LSEEHPQGQERRAHERYDVTLAVELEVLGAAVQGARLEGTTINLSRGGVLVDVGVRVPVDTSCRIWVTDAGARLSPETCNCSVVHTGVWKHGREVVALQFDEPLERLDLGAED